MSAAILVNGRSEALTAASVADLLAAHGITAAARGVAVALNGAVLPRRHWADTPLNDGDALEIVRPIQGG